MPTVTEIQANLSNSTALFAQIPTPIWGLFAVLMKIAGHVKEKLHGKALTAAAVAAGVHAVRFAMADLRAMFKWIDQKGFGVDVPDLRQRYPRLKDFRAWVREESAWRK